MTKTTIFQTQIGLLIKDGSAVKELGPGTYKTSKFRNETIVMYPAYSQTVVSSVSTRTLESAQITIQTSLGVTIEDVQKLYASGMTVYEAATKIFAQQIQEAMVGKSLAALLEYGLEISIDQLNRDIAVYGITAKLELAPTVHLPRNLQNAIDAQEVARQKAKAELEEARGRTAVIRHYANVAKVTQDNPDLLRLLLGQKAKAINVAFDAPGKAGK